MDDPRIAALADHLRATVQVGPFGKTALFVMDMGGKVSLTPEEASALASAALEHLAPALVGSDRPSIKVAGVPPALRAAAMLPPATLGAAWDANEFALGMNPPWSYLRRFLNELADAIESTDAPGEGAS